MQADEFSMNIQFIKPSLILHPYIERYWAWDMGDEKDIYMPVVPPGAGLDLFLHYRTPFVIDQKGQLSGSHLIFSREKSSKILPAGNCGFMAIRFRAGMFRNFTDIPLHELADLYPDVESIWGSNGKYLLQRINSIRDLSDKIPLLEQFLVTLLDKFRKDTPLWNNIIHELYYHQDSLKLDELSARLQLSYRHFRRKFKEETGLTPKHFQQLARFHATLKPLLLRKERKYLSVALDNGYFDQMHFIKEFKYFMEMTPSDFLQENNFMSHFYYSRL